MAVNDARPAKAGASAPRAAATLAVIRDAPGGLEVLLLRRAERGDHNSGAWVFPGGLVDAADRGAHGFCDGPTDADASAALGLAEGGLDFHVAAIRECFEEAGLLFAVDAGGGFVRLDGAAGERLATMRGPLGRGECGIADLCGELDLRLAADRLHYIAHWLTPLGRAKRFDTRFFAAVLPPGQDSAHDAVETTDHVWLRPSVALAPENTRRLMTPTRAVLAQLGAFADSAALLAWTAAPRSVTRVLPRLGIDRDGPRPVLPEEPAWAEIGRLDPEGRGDAWCALRADAAARLSPRLTRVTAPAGGNSYLVGGGAGGSCAVVGPACADAVHLDALLDAAPGPIGWIVALDGAQAAAAEALRARTGAALLRPATLGSASDGPDHDGRTLTIAADTTVRFVDIGGGSALLLVEEATLLTATDASTAPATVDATPIAWLAPGRGFLVAVPSAAMAAP